MAHGSTQTRIGDRRGLRIALIAAVVIVAGLVIVAPVAAIFARAFEQGVPFFLGVIGDPYTRDAIVLTVTVALIAVPINAAFGIFAAWAITKFEFRGRGLLLILIEIPFSVSPIVAGIAYVFVYGLQGLFGEALQAADIKILYALPGIVLASMFVTAPFVARELIPLMQAQGRDLEEAATSLGAGGLRTFLSVTLPNIRWALLYGVVLCNARVMGEFGAVSAVSGHLPGQTNTLPLHVERLYQGFTTTGAFAAAAVLTVLAVFTLIAKLILERKGAGRVGRSLAGPAQEPPRA